MKSAMNRKLSNTDSIFIFNCGNTCELSAHHFGRLLSFFRVNRYRITGDIATCSTVLINSCCVITGKRSDVTSKLHYALSLSHVKNVVLFGCFAGINHPSSNKIVHVSTKTIEQINTCFQHTVPITDISESSLTPESFLPYQQSHDPSVRYVLIAQGCENNCSYCNIKHAKGATISRPKSDIVEEIRKELSKGYLEYLLLADDCGSYGADCNTSIIDLLTEVLNLDSRLRIRIHYLYPQILLQHKDAFADLFGLNRITYINIPLQSGSNRVLELMNRKYDAGEVIRTIRMLKDVSPATWFYTHFILNFPTETEVDFNASLDASKIFDECLFMNYSMNPQTPAARFPSVAPDIMEHRLFRAQKFLDENGNGMLIDDRTGGPRLADEQ